MLIIPAIDLKDGKVVRFTRGKFNKKVYSHDPLKTAKHWARQGAKLIHVVDLDGAIEGKPKNLNILEGIVKVVKVPVEFGGGIRSRQMVERLVRMGVARVIIGTLAAEDPRFLNDVFKKFGDKVIVSVDEAQGKVLTRGWRKQAGVMKTSVLAKRLKKIGFGQIIYTDTSKDGTLEGPNLRGITAILRESGLKVIASGGVSSIKDIESLKRLVKKGLLGVIVGKALYEGRFTLAEALKAAA